MCPRPATSPADIPPSRMEMTSSRPHTPRHGDEDEEDPSPPESRASPSFSFHEEKRMLKSDEYFLSHKLARLPPAALSISTSPSASMYLDPLASPSYTMNQHRPLQLDEEEEAYAAKDDEEPESSSQAFPGKRRSTMLSPSGVENGDLDPAGILIHRVERDKDERLDLEEEKRERAIDGMSPIPLENDRVNNPQFDTGELAPVQGLRDARNRECEVWWCCVRARVRGCSRTSPWTGRPWASGVLVVWGGLQPVSRTISTTLIASAICATGHTPTPRPRA